MQRSCVIPIVQALWAVAYSQSLLVDMVSPRSWWSGRGQMSSGLQGSIGAVDRKGRFARVGSGSAIEKDIRSVGKDSVCITGTLFFSSLLMYYSIPS